jgi:hypothetical protein
MTQVLRIEVSNPTFEAIRRQADADGTSPAVVAAGHLERQFGGAAPAEAEQQAARERFERHFGSLDLGRPTGADNESIDADLAREYANRHEDG